MLSWVRSTVEASPGGDGVGVTTGGDGVGVTTDSVVVETSGAFGWDVVVVETSGAFGWDVVVVETSGTFGWDVVVVETPNKVVVGFSKLGFLSTSYECMIEIV